MRLHASILCLALALLLPARALAEEKPVGKVIGIVGTVEFLAGGPAAPAPAAQVKGGQVTRAAFAPWESAQFQQPVYAKDQFRTQAGSRLKILFMDNSLIALGPASKMEVESYIYKPADKMRKASINIAHGLSMYIVNKSQDNAASSFNIVSPTANIAARGTNGYVSVSREVTFVANQSGNVDTQNIDPKIKGTETVGNMMKNEIPKGQPPSKPVGMTPGELTQIRSLIVAAPVNTSSSKDKSGKSLITKEEKKSGKKEKEKDSDAQKKQGGPGATSGEGAKEGAKEGKAAGDGDKGKSGGTAPGATPSSAPSPVTSGASSFAEAFTTNSMAAVVGGAPQDFTPVNQPFTVASLSSGGCQK